ncbi:DUF3108 domain-containing protein [Maricaulis sp. CAU 1757]
MIKSLVQLSIAGLLGFGTAWAQSEDWIDNVNREALESGGFHLGLFVDGEPDGFMRFGWYSDDEGVHLWDRSMIHSRGDYEVFEALLDAATLSPISIDLRYHSGIRYAVVDSDLVAGKTTGSVDIHAPQQEVIRSPIDRQLEPGTLVRATFFMLASVLELEPGDVVEFDWWVPMRDAVETVTLTARAYEQVDTPAGQFDALRIEQRGGTPPNDIFVDRASGQVVRLDVPEAPFRYLAMPLETAGGDPS